MTLQTITKIEVRKGYPDPANLSSF